LTSPQAVTELPLKITARTQYHRPSILLLSTSNIGISTKSSLINKAIAVIQSGEYSSQAEATKKYRVDKNSISKRVKGKMRSKTTYFSENK
jgi:hypothetical protein